MPKGVYTRDRTACPKGHTYDATNTYRNGGKRLCRSCRSQYYRDNKSRTLARSRKNRAQLSYEQLRTVNLRTYGLTFADYTRMLTAQDGVCVICKGGNGSKRPLCVDHDHETGRIRGLLCIRCNSMLGWFERQGAEAVQEYLQ